MLLKSRDPAACCLNIPEGRGSAVCVKLPDNIGEENNRLRCLRNRGLPRRNGQRIEIPRGTSGRMSGAEGVSHTRLCRKKKEECSWQLQLSAGPESR